ncbi:pleckstrin homology domain-containing family O member 2 [Ctenopharyngodon idella]|uniref:pleckstrin homology domain-containing family O member 2 n=1 Tax=Ctenopharyngodon idella TaxID=7959 RepID=UPI0022307258|nr:pleckstrin homology domain-containing family O member 2 [Ctenopharyngodon idella]
MEDGVKEEPAKPKEVRSAGKAGWLKKSSGKFLSSYKDRYIQLDRTVIEVYENEELTKCLEKLDLDNYETCHELKSPFKKKHRLVLLRSPKSGNKVQDVKLQAPTPEEKEAWIKALSEGINKAKNKIFDEVTVDEGSSLEHVTRTRPKGNRGRRPPTRIHMKEVANVSSDGILRLDLDGDITMPNGTHDLNTEGDKQTETSVTVTMNSIPEEDTDEESTSQKKVIKPPMPPSKDNKPSESHKEDEPKNEEAAPQKKILTPPMPPSKDSKPCASVDGAAVEEDVSDSKVEVEKDSTDSSEQTPSAKSVQPPTPPSKLMKPSQPVTTEEKEPQEKNGEVDGASNEKEDQSKSEEVETFVISKTVIKPQVVMWDSPTLPSKEHSEEQAKKASDTTGEVATSVEPHQLNLTTVSTPESVKKSPGPPAPPKKKPFKTPSKNEDAPPQSDPIVLTNTAILSSEQASKTDDIKLTIPEPKHEAVGDVLSEELEEKSLDSGQHSGEESETGDQVMAPSAKLKGSSQVLDLEISEDDLEPSDCKAESLEEPSLKTPSTTPETSVLNAHPTPSHCANKTLLITVPLQHSFKARSASLGDLLAENAEKVESKGKDIAIKRHGSDVKDLQSKVSFEIEETGEMLNAIAAGQSGEAEMKGEATPEVLLNAAMEKLRKADQFLQEARSLKDRNKRLSL